MYPDTIPGERTTLIPVLQYAHFLTNIKIISAIRRSPHKFCPLPGVGEGSVHCSKPCIYVSPVFADGFEETVDTSSTVGALMTCHIVYDVVLAHGGLTWCF